MFKRMTREELNKLTIGDAIQPNTKYRKVYDVNDNETDFFIEEKDILFIRGVIEDGFIVELRDDVLNKEAGREFRYGYFKIHYDMIANKISHK